MLQVANELLMLREDNSVVQFSDATFFDKTGHCFYVTAGCDRPFSLGYFFFCCVTFAQCFCILCRSSIFKTK